MKLYRNIFSNIKQNFFHINVSIYSRRITKSFYQKLTFWQNVINFVWDNISKSTLLLMLFTTKSNLFLIEFILKWAKMSLTASYITIPDGRIFLGVDATIFKYCKKLNMKSNKVNIFTTFMNKSFKLSGLRLICQ